MRPCLRRDGTSLIGVRSSLAIPWSRGRCPPEPRSALPNDGTVTRGRLSTFEVGTPLAPPSERA